MLTTQAATRLDRALPALEEAIGAWPPGGLLAVRSSATVEDGDQRSAAGMYLTVLHVGLGRLHGAVRRVLEHRPPPAVPTSSGPDAIAVLVQPQLSPRAAGVASTADPVSGARDQCVVEAARGLGVAVTAGQTTPETWEVGASAARRSGPPVLSGDEAARVAELARRVGAHFDVPVYVEWALQDGKLWLLQARPMTGLPVVPVEAPLSLPPGPWIREGIHYPYPLLPLERPWLAILNDGTRRMAAWSGLLLDLIDHTEVQGMVYHRPVPVGATAAPGEQEACLQRRVAIAVEAVRSDLWRTRCREWFARDRAAQRQANARWLEVDLGAAPDDAALEHFRAAWRHLRRSAIAHLQYAVSSALLVGELMLVCEETVGLGTADTLALLAGASSTSTAPARALREMAHRIAAIPGGREVLERGGARVEAGLRNLAPAAAAAWTDTIARFGHRAFRYGIGGPTLAECPGLMALLAAAQLTEGATEVAPAEAERDRLLASLRRRLAEGSPPRERFERALAGALVGYPVREDNELHTLSVPFAIVRYAALELGRRLAARGQLAATDQVFYLFEPELEDGLRTGGALQALVEKRRGQEAFVLSSRLPTAVGVSGPPPPLPEGLPPEVMRVAAATARAIGEMIQQPGSDAQSGVNGQGASPGRYTGPARIIRDEADFDRLLPGDVLVCPVPAPVWSVLFANAGALVTDRGGLFTHGVVIAREFGIPAVVATGDATARLEDGQLVCVDGRSGSVEVVTAC